MIWKVTININIWNILAVEGARLLIYIWIAWGDVCNITYTDSNESIQLCMHMLDSHITWRTVPCALNFLSVAWTWWWTYYDYVDGNGILVFSDAHCSKGWLQFSLTVRFPSKFDTWRYILHLLMKTPGGSQWLNWSGSGILICIHLVLNRIIISFSSYWFSTVFFLACEWQSFSIEYSSSGIIF